MGSSASSSSEPTAMEDGAKLGGVEATRVSTRAVDKERIHDQRRRASQVVDSMPKKQRRSSTIRGSA